MSTSFVSKEDAEKSRKWVLIDASEIPVGRLASRIVTVLRGKHKPSYTPHADDGDFVVVVNAEKVKLTGSKPDQKMYFRHSSFPGGLKSARARDVLAEKPERVIQKAVNGMLPKGPLGYQLATKLKVYAGPDHPHGAQKPEVLDIMNKQSAE